MHRQMLSAGRAWKTSAAEAGAPPVSYSWRNSLSTRSRLVPTTGRPSARMRGFSCFSSVIAEYTRRRAWSYSTMQSLFHAKRLRNIYLTTETDVRKIIRGLKSAGETRLPLFSLQGAFPLVLFCWRSIPLRGSQPHCCTTAQRLKNAASKPMGETAAVRQTAGAR